MEKTAFLTRKKADTAEGNCFQLIHFSYAVTNDLPAMDVGVCPCVKRNFEYDDAETNVKRYSEGRLGGFEATFLSSYLASSAVLGVESRKKRKGESFSWKSRQFLAAVRESFTEIGKRYDYDRFAHEGSRHLVYLQIPPRENGSTMRGERGRQGRNT